VLLDELLQCIGRNQQLVQAEPALEAATRRIFRRFCSREGGTA
jgi:hypothetical protein